MEADLHAIVGLVPAIEAAIDPYLDSIGPTAVRRSLPVLPLSDLVWSQGNLSSHRFLHHLITRIDSTSTPPTSCTAISNQATYS
jgi:hypothetical protein